MGAETKKARTSKNTKPILNLSQVKEEEVVLPGEVAERIDNILAAQKKRNPSLGISDIIAHYLLEKPSGFKVRTPSTEPQKVTLRMPYAAWDILEKSVKKTEGATTEDALRTLFS